MVSETIELLGKNIYTDIPGKLTLKSFPTTTELDYVGSEDFEKTMLEDIFPKCIEEQVNFSHLLEIDFQWICRGFRFLNYGPYYTTNMILCDNCGTVRGEYQVDLRSVDCKTLPDDFTGDIVVKKDELIDYQKDVHFHLLTIQEAMDLRKDKLFFTKDGTSNTQYARLCYSISGFGNGGKESINALSAKLEIEKNMSPADLKVLMSVSNDLTDYGLRGGGRCACPQCHSKGAAFIALADDRFFRPTVGDLREGRNDRNLRGMEISSGDKAEAV